MEGFSNAPDASTANGAKSAFRLGKTAVSTRRAKSLTTALQRETRWMQMHQIDLS